MILDGVAVSVAVLVVVLLVGVVAGRAKRRLVLLVGGLVAVVVFGAAVTALSGGPDADQAAAIARLYDTAVPLAVAFLAGWLCGRAGWFARFAVIAVAVLVIAAFPYPAAGKATAELLHGPGPAAVG